MWQRFTERARSVILKSQEIAQTTHSESIESIHLLHSLTEHPDCAAMQVLGDLIDTRLFKGYIKQIIDSTLPVKSAEPKMTSQVKRVLELASDEARYQMDHSYIGTEHILVALTRENSSAQQVLTEFKIDTAVARKAVIQFLTARVPKIETSNAEEYLLEDMVAQDTRPSGAVTDLTHKGTETYIKGMNEAAVAWKDVSTSVEDYSRILSKSHNLIHSLTHELGRLELIEKALEPYGTTDSPTEDTLAKLLDMFALHFKILKKVAEYREARNHRDETHHQHWLLICAALDEAGIHYEDLKPKE